MLSPRRFLAERRADRALKTALAHYRKCKGCAGDSPCSTGDTLIRRWLAREQAPGAGQHLHKIFDRPQRGAVLLEFALVLGILLLLLFGGLDLQTALIAKSQITYIAQQSALCAVQSGCNAATLAQTNAAAAGFDTARFSYTISGTCGTATYQWRPIFPFYFSELNLSDTACWQ